METVGFEPTSDSLQARRSAWLSYIPGGRRGRVESNHHSRRRQGYSLLSSPVLSVRKTIKGWPAGLEPTPRGSQPRVLPLHHGHHGAGTTGLEPAASRLTSECSARLSYAPTRKNVIARVGFEPTVSSS